MPVGNTDAFSRPSIWASGSSPRPWGTHVEAGSHVVVRRFIPTPVGNTFCRCQSGGIHSVHPHARGEHGYQGGVGAFVTGSSPRPWGTRAVSHYPRLTLRFIPTPVGNTPQPWRPGAARTVHPHARGEHGSFAVAVTEPRGSSPRPWGTPPMQRAEAYKRRFIPTPVGNTFAVKPKRPERPVHPHARGEHSNSHSHEAFARGSSPRPWGTLQRHQRRLPLPRFIPTPVGNTGDSAKRWPHVAVHPHARGEHCGRLDDHLRMTGSSPRPWGTRCLKPFNPKPRPVHPHARGEHSRSTAKT